MRVDATDPDELLARHWRRCRRRIGPFVARHYRWPRVLRLQGEALGLDLLRAPVNVLLAFPSLGVQVLALALAGLGRGAASRRLLRVRLGFQTAVERTLVVRLRRELLGLEGDPGSGWELLLARPPFAGAAPELRDALRGRLADPGLTAAADALVERYAATRRSASDLTAALVVGTSGLVAFGRFTPGSLSAGEAIAAGVTRHAAIEHFWLGPGLGALYYRLFPPATPWWADLAAIGLVALGVSLCAAFAGLVADPVQAWSGLHRRRLVRLLGAIARVVGGGGGRYRPWDPYVVRLVDVWDVLKGLGG